MLNISQIEENKNNAIILQRNFIEMALILCLKRILKYRKILDDFILVLFSQ